jgi:hypothetical protein
MSHKAEGKIESFTKTRSCCRGAVSRRGLAREICEPCLASFSFVRNSGRPAALAAPTTPNFDGQMRLRCPNDCDGVAPIGELE